VSSRLKATARLLLGFAMGFDNVRKGLAAWRTGRSCGAATPRLLLRRSGALKRSCSTYRRRPDHPGRPRSHRMTSVDVNDVPEKAFVVRKLAES